MSVWIALSESGLRPGNAQATLSTSLHRKFVIVNGVLPDAERNLAQLWKRALAKICSELRCWSVAARELLVMLAGSLATRSLYMNGALASRRLRPQIGIVRSLNS